MKKILMSLLTVALVSAAVFGATQAYFTDTEIVNNNTFSTGEIDLTTDPTTTAVTMNNAEPGVWYKTGKIIAKNNSSIETPLKWKVSSEYVNQNEAGMWGKMKVSVWVKGLGYNQSPKTAPDGSKIWAKRVFHGKLSDLDKALNEMPQNDYANMWFFNKLDESAGNNYQNKWVKFNLVFVGTQNTNSGWTE